MTNLLAKPNPNQRRLYKQLITHFFFMIFLYFLLSPQSIFTEEKKIKEGFIESQVLDPEGKPLAGILVTANTGFGDNPDKIAHGLTDSEGKIRFTVLPGNYSLAAASDKYESTFKKDVLVKNNLTCEVILKMKTGGHILKGIVKEETNDKALSAKIYILRSDEFRSAPIFLIHSKDGEFRIKLPKSAYTIFLSKDNYISISDQLELKKSILNKTLYLTPEPGQAPKEVVDWIRAKAIPLKTVEAGHGFADMMPLKKMIGHAQVVSLGEATHGTREFFQMKHRMLEFLVKNMGFTVFAIETNLPEAFAVNDYVLTGKGDPAKALAGLYFWTWNTKEVLEMIHWMRRYNKNPLHKKKVKFYGFDMQQPKVALADVLTYLKKVDPEKEKQMKSDLEPLFVPYFEFQKLSKNKMTDLKNNLENLLHHFAEKTTTFTKASSKPLFERMCQYVRILIQYTEMMADIHGGYNVRDRSMAENVLWLLEQEGPGTKAVLWAHNGHVQRSKHDLAGTKWMGWYLNKTLGPKQIIFGFAFNQGGFQAIDSSSKKRGLFKFNVNSHPKATLDRALAATGIPIFALDFRELPKTGVIKDWFQQKQGTRSFGALYNDEASKWYVSFHPVIQRYDALFFIEKTSAAIANPKEQKKTKIKGKKSAKNINFEKGDLGQFPPGWRLSKSSSGKKYNIQLSNETPKEGKFCLKIFNNKYTTKDPFGTVMQSLDAKPFQGKKIRLTGWIKGNEGSRASLWLRVDRPTTAGFFDNMGDRMITKPHWTNADIECQVDKDATVINFGCIFVGRGPVFFDDIKIEIINTK